MAAITKTEKSTAKKVNETKKTKTVAKTASHPTYFEMIKEALVALGESSGSSPYAIAKYMEEKHKTGLPSNFRKILSLQLKNSATKGKLTKVKASYKLSEAGKKDKPAAAPKKAAVAAKPAPKKKAGAVVAKAGAVGSKRKAEDVKKVVKTKKKATPVKKAKQPKSIKSPVKKKAKKA